MELFEAIKKRSSVRTYIDKPIEKQKLEQIIEAGIQAPTARAIEPWEFVVLTDKEKIKTVANITDHGKFMKDASACIVVYSSDTKYYLEDCCAATQNILLAAAALGVGSCWIAGDKKPYCAQISKELKVPLEYKLVSIISLGLAKEPSKKSRKRAIKDVLHWEKF